MKKIVCTLLALAMLCSLIVVSASAANTYTGEGFEIVTDSKFDFEGGPENFEGDESYTYFLSSKEFDAEIEIFVDDVSEYMSQVTEALESEPVTSCKDFYELYKDACDNNAEPITLTNEIKLDGIPAFMSTWDDYNCATISVWSDSYHYSIDIEAEDKEAFDALYDIVIENFDITTPATWCESAESGADDTADKDDTDDKAEKDDKVEKEEEKEDKAEEADKEVKAEKDAEEKDNSTIIIVAIVVGGVVVLGAVAIVVLGKKKKQ